MNITYCWTEPSGYLAACLNELARRPGVNVSLIHWAPSPIAPFDLSLFREVTPSFAEEERERLRLLVEEVGRSRRENDRNAAAKRKTAAPKKAPKKKGG